ncbi:MAG: hypothetical protein WC413_01560 [Candidatus Nanoarchaeia archaeon]
MKRSTCKLLIGIGIILPIISLPLFVISLFLFVIAIAKWNSETEFKSLKQRAKVHIHTKAKYKDLE